MIFEGIFDSLIEMENGFDINKVYTHILNAYDELKRAHELGLYEFKIKDKKVEIKNEHNYKKKLKKIEDNFKYLKLLLPKDTKLINIPRDPFKIKKFLEESLVKELDEDNVKYVIESLFGSERKTKRNDFEKFKLDFSKKLKRKPR